MKVKCLFQSSIYTIKMSHSILLIIYQAFPNNWTIPSFINSAKFRKLVQNFYLFQVPLDFCDMSKMPPLKFRILENNGTNRFLEISQSKHNRSLVFLFIKTPSQAQCFYLYMAIQVYSSPNLRLQQQTVMKVQQRSGRVSISFFKNEEEFNDLLREDGSSSMSAELKSEQNLFLYFSSKLCNLKIYGLLL